jgi:hypoxanthine-DNA glycosylase
MNDTRIKMGLQPVFDSNSKVLILGSFPSVKSRETSFYYGNKQNRFWRMLCGYFHEEVPVSNEEKKAFLLRNRIALWDIVTECEIVGSSDATLKNAKIANLAYVLENSQLERVLLNGSLAWKLFTENYPSFPVLALKMPSTSPANPRYDEILWKKALDEILAIQKAMESYRLTQEQKERLRSLKIKL